MAITEEKKVELFEKVLKLEHLAERETFDHRNYFEQADGAFQMLMVLGLQHEYIEWSFGK